MSDPDVAGKLSRLVSNPPLVYYLVKSPQLATSCDPKNQKQRERGGIDLAAGTLSLCLSLPPLSVRLIEGHTVTDNPATSLMT